MEQVGTQTDAVTCDPLE